jgi:opacity protein-like surface antigen
MQRPWESYVRRGTLDTSVSFSAGILPERRRSLKESWFDPVIGIRGNWNLSEKWSASAFADYGGFSSSSESWQVLGTLDYSINENFSARFGYRHMEISKTIINAEVDIGLSGPVIGLTYRF